MKTLYISKDFKYSGEQLHSLFSYFNYNLLGDSIVAWTGPCEVKLEHMVDGEDYLENAQICGANMVHFLVEKFNISLFAGVGLQRLLTNIARDVIQELSPEKAIAQELVREGDDLFFKNKKLSISIATQSPVSTLIHYAVNITNEGTPVETLSLQDLKVTPKNFIDKVLQKFSTEVRSMEQATQKVKWVK